MKTLTNNPATSQLTRKCLGHLKTEIGLLEEFLQRTNSIFDSFGSDEPIGEAENQQWQVAMAEKSKKQETARNTVRTLIEKALGVSSHQATVRTLIDALPEDNNDVKELVTRRQQLLDLELEIQKQNRTNSMLIRQSVDLFQRIALEMTDQKPALPTYSPTGELTDNGSSTFMQTDC